MEIDLEAAAEAVKPLFDSAGLVDHDAEDYAWDAVKAAAPLIAAQVRAQVAGELPEAVADRVTWSDGTEYINVADAARIIRGQLVTAPAKGDRFFSPEFSADITVNRVARDAAWADITVRPWGGTESWRKRQPLRNGAFPYRVLDIEPTRGSA